jgi:hypothetical protein
VTFSIDGSSDSGVCSLSAGVVSFTGVGNCVLDADQAGSTDYSAAPEVQQSFAIGQATLSVVCTPGTLSAANYTFVTGSSGTLTITQASQSVSFYSSVLSSGMVYGHPPFRPGLASSTLHELYSNPVGQCTVGGLQLLVTITGAGSCSVTISQPGNADYQAASPVRATFSIAKATLSVNAQSVSVPYGGTPRLTYFLSGFFNGDTVAALTGRPVCSIAPGTPTNAGTYPGAVICLPGATTGANYRVVQGATGTLTIAKLSQAIHFLTKQTTVVYGGRYVVNAIGGASGNPVTFSIDPTSTPGACSVSGQTVSFTGVGTCLINANQAGSTNYMAAPQARQRALIRAAMLTVAANPQTMAVGGPIPPLTASITGFVNGETAGGSVTGAPHCTTTATTASHAGTYPITCTRGTLAAAHYTFRFVPSTLTVH